MTVIKICILALAGVLFIVIVKGHTPAYGTVLQMCIIIVVFVGTIPDVKQLLQAMEVIQLTEYFSNSGLKVMLKVFSVLAVGSVCSDICRDNGEGAIAGAVELSAKLAAIACALPVFTAVISLATAFLKG